MATPKVIHQTWKTTNLNDLPLFKLCQKEWTSINPSYTYKFYTDADLRAVIEKWAPEYLTFYDQMQPKIKQVDFFRYVLLWGEGGVYADMDMYPLRSIDHYVDSGRLVLGREPPEHAVSISNALMISPPRHPFWKILLRYIQENYSHSGNPVWVTGPGILDKLYKEHPWAYQGVLIVEPKIFFPMTNRATNKTLAVNIGEPRWFRYISKSVSDLNDTIAIHLWSNSWTRSPNTNIDFLGKDRGYRIPLVIFLLVVFLGFIVFVILSLAFV